MPLVAPRLDDRGYDQILRETIARIPVHTPEWTNFSPSDPGMTLLELFAFMTDSLLYRVNLLPERNRLKFLQLLGIPLQPAAAARGVVAFANDRGPLQTVTLPGQIQVLAGKVGFVTTNALDVLPIEGRAFFRRPLSASEAEAAKALWDLYQPQADADTDLEFYEAVPFDPPESEASMPVLDLGGEGTVDRSVWLALMAREVDRDTASKVVAQLAGRTLTLGLMPAPEISARTLRPGGTPPAALTLPLQYQLYTGMSGEQPTYVDLQPQIVGEAGQEAILVELTLPAWSAISTQPAPGPLDAGVGDFPPVLQDDALNRRLLGWLRIRVRPGADQAALASGAKVRFTWLGINAARITQRIDVVGESLGTGTGEPDQRFRLANTPVLPGSLRLVVGGELWTEIDDLLAAAPEVPLRDPTRPPGTPPPPLGDARRFAVDAESGEVRAGDGLRGKRFPKGALLLASYSYGGGPLGNVGIDAVKASPSLPAGFSVSNPIPTWGGAAGETVAEGERAIPQELRHRRQAVSARDFEEIVLRTPGVDLGRVDVLPLLHPDFTGPAPGVVTVLVVPIDPRRPEGPEPDQYFLRAVCEYLEPRRLLTTEVHVRGPRYVPIAVSIGIDVVPGQEQAKVRQEVEARIRAFLSPLDAGENEPGWPLNKAVEPPALLVQAARAEGVAAVRGVLLWGPASTTPVSRVPISGLELPRLDRFSVSVGDPDDIITPAATDQARRRLPVPILPPEC
jgi:baseplate J-like protein